MNKVLGFYPSSLHQNILYEDRSKPDIPNPNPTQKYINYAILANLLYFNQLIYNL